MEEYYFLKSILPIVSLVSIYRPVLIVTFFSQTILSGMGELHLEIILDRIRREHKVEANLGKLQVAYREAPAQSINISG